MTKNIMFVRGEKYVCVDDWCDKVKNKILVLHDFINNDCTSPIEFKDESGKIIRFSCWDCGSIISLKMYRKLKLLKIGKCNSKT